MGRTYGEFLNASRVLGGGAAINTAPRNVFGNLQRRLNLAGSALRIQLPRF